MAIQFGNDKIEEIYVGSDAIKVVYYGSEKVWGKYYIQDGYWVHKDTGVKTYFGVDADFITGRIMNTPSWATDCSEVQIPSRVTGLGNQCFSYCESLTSITLPEGVTSIGGSCFHGCSSLTSITLPESVTSLGTNCFRNCTSLILATLLPAIPPIMGWNVFTNTHPSFGILVHSPYVNAYKTAMNWSDYADKISDGYWVHKDTGVKTVFGLEDPSIVDGIMSAPSWGPDCSEVNIPEGVTSLGSQAFSRCTSLTSITLPEGLTSIGENAFQRCTSLTSITLPEGLTSIGENAFYLCRDLTSITLPDSLTSIGSYAFKSCRSLSLVTSLPTIPPSLSASVFDDTHANLIIKVPTQSVNAYKTATNWNSHASIISAI